MFSNSKICMQGILLATLCLAGSGVEPLALAQVPGSSPVPVSKLNSSQSIAAKSPRATRHFEQLYGIEITGIRPVSSGEMVRVTYRVVDVEKAKPLINKDSKPFLIDELTKMKLEVPVMEKIGPLRQSTSAPQAGREYWMIFQNTRGVVKPGSRVEMVIGHVHMNGLVVD